MLEILGNIGFDWHIALANIANFLIIFFVLKKFAFGPIKKVIAERANRIQEGLDNATRAETALTMAGEERSRVLAKAETEATDVIASAKKSGDALVLASKNAAEREAEEILAKTRARLIREQKEMEMAVNEKIVDTVLLGVTKVLQEEVNQERGEKIIKKFLAQS
ncbi:MAG: F-type H+-transporting ATPase subunit b [Parcubacteria group bacterium Gr01-1014_48]|nr:MAG: F-type H+-transporting ATPase subunit b [Parcubacteria group bacterium Greene0416_14]TSC72779.1 MAG: F-type H+-transporting ATPase subunit b [Parcubacteria group bacterium Gr01-1014_48]TSD01492.1 MAG: F-type H+-transporting ATPase subunit b [Parcubacteria group bacterium Greene1014_15]TSD07909.1 MAG: F-type H+-transporting ATPase subunit b [Parcubacteria group bacterium Greene0714_4]